MEESNQKLDLIIQNLENQHHSLNQKMDDSLQVFANTQIMINTLTQFVQSQVNIMNQMSQQINYLTLKLTDMEVSNQNNDTSLSEIVDNQRSLMTQLEDLKTAVENVRIATMYSY